MSVTLHLCPCRKLLVPDTALWMLLEQLFIYFNLPTTRKKRGRDGMGGGECHNSASCPPSGSRREIS